jgi:hypothetical protein
MKQGVVCFALALSLSCAREASAGSTHLLVGGAFGFCTRGGADTGTAGVCADSPSITIDVALPARADLHWRIEGGYQIMPQGHWHDVRIGSATGTGGGYFFARTMLGKDFTSALAFRWGAQVRATSIFGDVTGGFAGVADLGTRVGRVDLGLRTFAGADAVQTIGGSNRLDWAFVFSTQIFVQVALL